MYKRTLARLVIYTSGPSNLFLGLLLLLLRLRCGQLEAIRASVRAGSDLLPRASAALKVAERLSELERLSDNALLLLVVSDLGVTGEGEVLSQGVALETVVGHDSAEIGVVGEVDTKQVVNLTLIPVGTVEERSDAGNGGGLVGVGLDTDTGVVADTEEVVDDLESLVSGRVVGSGDVADLGELGRGVVCVVLVGVRNATSNWYLHFRNEKRGIIPEGET